MLPRFHTASLAIAVLLVAHAAAGELHEMPEHGLRASLPSGWQRIEALSGNTVLKLARTDTPGKEARIVIVALLAKETLDLSTIPRDDHIRALEGGSMLGEKVSVINVGRTKVGGLDALWSKTYRNLPSRSSTYEYTYEFFREYKGVPKAFTIRLTSYGDEHWFQANSVVFDGFIQSVRFNLPSNLQPSILSESQRLGQPLQSHPKTVRSSPEPARLEIAEAEPFWLALFKGFGEVFLLILLTTIAVGVGKWVYSKYVASAASAADRKPPGSA